jgi:hypothetical protein
VGGLGCVEDLPDVAGEVALEAADRCAFGFALGGFAIEIGAGRRVGACTAILMSFSDPT